MLSLEHQVYAALGVLLVAAVVALQSRRARKLPPGPPANFFSGNAHQIPTGAGGREFLQWSRKYSSDIIHLRNYSQHIVVLNSETAIRDLFVRRSEIYSDRPQSTMYSELVGRNRTVFNSNYGDRFRGYMKLMHPALSKAAVAGYGDVLDGATRKLALALVRSPEKFMHHIRTCAGRISLKIAYGYEVEDEDDYYVELVRKSIALGNEAFRPGRWLVDTFPILRFVPSWLPGAGFQRWASNSRKTMDEMTRAPIEKVKEQIANGDALPSFSQQNLLNPKTHEDMVVWSAAAMYVGTADTTSAYLGTFIWLMVCYPDIQRRAREELDDLLNGERLPNPDDKESLPYTVAVMKECMRYNTVGPLALAHSLRREDTYKGYTLPKGSTVYANMYAVTRDPSIYSDPHMFNPNRFYPPEGAERDPWDFAFGMGLRRCPGWQLADAMIFLTVARLLALFEFLPERDEKGRDVLPIEEWSPGPNCGPMPFMCRIVPRSKDTSLLEPSA